MENIHVRSDTSSSLHNQSDKTGSRVAESLKKRHYKKNEEIKATPTANAHAIQTELSYSVQSQNSIKSRKDMIEKALQELPGKKGTKAEIFSKITDIFKVNLDNPEAPIVRTLSQQLCKQFGRSAQDITLNLEEIRPQDHQTPKNPSMKQIIIAALLDL